MFTLAGPILAQLVTLNVAERTEARVTAADDTYYEATTRPLVGARLDWRRASFQVFYGPSLTLTPLESEPRDLIVFHAAGLAGSYRWHAYTLTVSQSLGYGVINPRDQALAAGQAVPPTNNTGTAGGTGNGGATNAGMPNGGTGTGTSTAANPLLYLNQNVRYATSTSSASVTHPVSADLSLTGTASYVASGSLDASTRASYPLVFGPAFTGTASEKFDHANSSNFSLALQYALASTGDQTYVASTTETWVHLFGPRLSSMVGAGVSGGRNSRVDGYVAYSIYPNAVLGLSDSNQLHPGTLTLSLLASSAPALDPVTLAVDPRVTLGGTASYQRGIFSSSLAGSTTFSITNQTRGFGSAGGALTVGLHFSPAVAVDGGVRTAWQVYQGQTALPLTYAGFIALTLAASSRL